MPSNYIIYHMLNKKSLKYFKQMIFIEITLL